MGTGKKPTGWDQERGARIRAYRKAKEWNQEKFAQELGIDQSTVSDIENGAGFSAELLIRMTDRLRVPSGVIMRGHDESAWPFPRVALDRVLSLQPDDLGYVEGKLSAALDEVTPPEPTPEEMAVFEAAHQRKVKPAQRKRRA